MGGAAKDVHTGAHGRFTWLETSEFGLADLLRVCPQIVLGKHVVVSAFDSGPLRLTPEEIAAGWVQQEELALSPRITDVTALPYDDYDEWFIVDQPSRFAAPTLCLFMSHTAFTLRDPTFLAEGADPTWDQKAISAWQESLAQLQADFWNCLDASGAISYVGSGDRFVVATSDASLASALAAVLRSHDARRPTSR